MRRRAKKPTKSGSGSAKKKETPLNAPFKRLDKLVNLRREVATKPARETTPRRREKPGEEQEPEASFLLAVADVVRLPQEARRVDSPPGGRGGKIRRPRPIENEAAFADLVATSFTFDISDSEEYMEGAVVGLDPRLVRRLRQGEFSHQDYIDLHGMTADEAKPAVDRFVARSLLAGFRCVLIVHGRGLNSAGQRPVLKHRLKQWLSSGPHARTVLAFTTARPVDGGAGALCVLLRRQKRKKHAIHVFEGAKR